MAGENEALWRVYLTWSALLTNLQANNLIDDVDAGRLAAHCGTSCEPSSSEPVRTWPTPTRWPNARDC